MAKILRSNGCHWRKGLFLVLWETDVEWLGYRNLCRWSKGKIRFFSSQLRKTVPFARCHQKTTMCLKGWKKPEVWQVALLAWLEGRGGAGALGRSDGTLARGTFEDKLCPLHKKEDVCPAPAGFAFVDLLSMQHLNIICLSLGTC